MGRYFQMIRQMERSQRRLERRLFPCPVVDKRKYPADSKLMDPNCEIWTANWNDSGWKTSYIYPVVRTKDGKKYLELYFFDADGKVVSRFVIVPGARMKEKEQERYFKTVKAHCWEFAQNSGLNSLELIRENFQEWNVLQKEETDAVLKHIYYASHRSGAREILYKAGMIHFAEEFENIPCHNLLGTNPETIINCGMPLKLLRVMDCFGISKFYSQESINQCLEVYRKYSGYFGRNISAGQWMYLEELLPGGIFEGEKFNRTLFNRMEGYNSCRKQVLDNYREYMIWREQFPFLKKRKLPRYSDVLRLNRLLNSTNYSTNCRKETRRINQLIQARKKEGGFEYRNREYHIVMPTDAFAFHIEAAGQENCVMDYMEKHANRDTTILFLRKNEEPDFPYVTVRVEQNKVVEAEATFNIDVSDEVAEFLEEYEQWLQTKEEDPNDLHNIRPARLPRGKAEATS